MNSFLLLVSYTLLELCIPAFAQKVFVVAPNVFRFNVDEEVYVVFGSNSDAEVYLTHKSDTGKRISTIKKSFIGNVPQTVKLKIQTSDIPRTWDGNKLYFELNVKVGTLIKSSPVLLNMTNGLVFIQTNKPIYTPKQNVRFRVIAVGIDLKPSRRKVTVEIKNPTGVRVRRIHYDINKSEFITDQMGLSDHPDVGTWSITAIYGHARVLSSTVHFVVEEYVLPKFSVQIKVTPYITALNSTIDFSVTARYTYGKKVRGMLHLRLGVLKNSKVTPFYTLRKTIHGRLDFDNIQSDLILKPKSIPNFPIGSNLFIEANVTEKATGDQERATDVSVECVKSPYKFSFKRSILYYKPNLNYLLQFDVLYPNGKPVALVPVQIEGNVGPDVITYDKVDDNIVRTNLVGQAQFTMNVPSSPKGDKVMKLRLSTTDPEEENIKEEIHVQCFQSNVNRYISVRAPDSVPLIGQQANIEAFIVDGSQTVKRLFYLVIARGIIVDHGMIPKNVGIITSLPLKVSAIMAPSCRILVYYVAGNEVVADAVRLEVEKEFENKVSLASDRSEISQDINPVLTIRAANDSQIGLLAVDESVYLLRKKDRLTRTKVFSEIESLDFGCGQGGGLNSQDVFERTGLGVITDLKFSTKRRETLRCGGEGTKSRKRRSISSSLKQQVLACCKLSRCCDIETLNFPQEELSCEKLADQQSSHWSCREVFKSCCRGTLKVSGRSLLGENFESSFSDEDFKLELDQLQRRMSFQEYWIWTEKYLKGRQLLEEPVSAPSTITSWIISAIAMSPTKGFGLSSPLRITNTKKFFVDLKLPYAVKRFEQITIHAVIYNYFPQRQRAAVYMSANKYICYAAKPGERTKPVIVPVEGSDTVSVPFTILPIKVGELSIIIEVAIFGGGDSVEKKLRIEPEGFKKTETQAIFLDPQNIMKGKNDSSSIVSNREDGRQSDTINVIIPDSVPGSESAYVYVTGSIMGSVVTEVINGGFDSLIALPTGCGEQVMIKMAPLAYLLRYLERGKSGVTNDVERRIYKYLREGYTQVLKYQRFDNSFSAWGNGRGGSTWLTAFVVKVLCQSREFIKDDIDDNVIVGAMEFLSNEQLKDGSFPEKHKVIHREMVGAIDGDIPMTAFVVASMMECKKLLTDTGKTSIQLASLFLERNLLGIKSMYAMSLVAYALALTNSPEKRGANDRLRSMMTTGTRKGKRVAYWKKGTAVVSAIDIETTSYALLTQLKLDDIDMAGPIVVWLTQQRNAKGSFFSTQDTCVALQALSEYSIRSAGGELDLTVRISAEKSTKINKVLKLTRENALVRLQHKIDMAIGGNVYIDTKGRGTAQLQIVTEYNVPRIENAVCGYDLMVDTVEQNSDGIILSDDHRRKENGAKGKKKSKGGKGKKKGKGGKGKKKGKGGKGKKKKKGGKGKKKWKGGQGKKKVDCNDPANSYRKKCKKLLKEQQAQSDAITNTIMMQVCVRDRSPSSSGMAIIDIGLLTGFEPDIDSIKELMRDDKKLRVNNYEISQRSLVLHFDTIPHQKQECIVVTLKRIFTVGEVQPVPVKVYDYYEPHNSCTSFYAPTKGSHLLGKLCEGTSCTCDHGGCGSCTARVHIEALKRFACIPSGFVFRGKVLTISDEDGQQKTLVRIKKIFKEGARDEKENGNVYLYKRKSCPCPILEPQEEYLFIVKDGVKYVLDGDTIALKLPEDTRSIEFAMESISTGYVCDMYNLNP